MSLEPSTNLHDMFDKTLLKLIQRTQGCPCKFEHNLLALCVLILRMPFARALPPTMRPTRTLLHKSQYAAAPYSFLWKSTLCRTTRRKASNWCVWPIWQMLGCKWHLCWRRLGYIWQMLWPQNWTYHWSCRATSNKRLIRRRRIRFERRLLVDDLA
jgi:hypothetical protein